TADGLREEICEVHTALRPQVSLFERQMFLNLADQMKQASKIRLAHPQRAFHARDWQEAHVRTELDSEVITILVFEFRTQAEQGYGSGRQLPRLIELPKVPGAIDLDG